MIRAALVLVGVSVLGQTLPRPAAAFEFTLVGSKTGPSRLAEYKGRCVILYLFSPD